MYLALLCRRIVCLSNRIKRRRDYRAQYLYHDPPEVIAFDWKTDLLQDKLDQMVWDYANRLS